VWLIEKEEIITPNRFNFVNSPAKVKMVFNAKLKASIINLDKNNWTQLFQAEEAKTKRRLLARQRFLRY